MQIGSKKFGDCPSSKRQVLRIDRRPFYSPTYISSRGEMKTSLRLITYCAVQHRCFRRRGVRRVGRDIFMLQVLQ